jgi:S1-C subfamily serine protease
LVVLAAVALTLAAGPMAARKILTERAATLAVLAQDRLDGENILEQISRAKRDVATAVEPSVVYIEADVGSGRGQSNGSGWVYSADGHVVTNAHVVLGGRNVRVQFSDGRVREAVIVGLDESTDIAVLKVEPGDARLIPMRLASNRDVSQGEVVFAFGSPFGFKFSMSEGIVSGLGRHARTTLTGPVGYTNYIQTDAAVNPGNSGGPLVNVRGEVIGMNTAIITRDELIQRENRADTGVSGGVSFAIPLETIQSVVDQMIERGYVLKGYLGVYLDRLNFEAAEEAGFRERGGVVITGLQPGTPASNSGLREFDIITGVNDTLTPNLTVLRSTISNREPGETIRVRVWREGEDLEIPVTLAAAAVVGNQLQPLTLEQTLRLGDEAAAFSHVVSRLARFGLTEFDDAARGGVEVRRVRDRSPAAQLGFEPGLVLREINGTDVASREEFLRSLAQMMLADRASFVRVSAVDPRQDEEIEGLRIILGD